MLFRYFYARPLQLAVVLVIASLLGVGGYLRMPRNMYPDVERPQVTVITQLPGAAAESVAQKVSRPIEQALYALSLVHDVQSTSRNEVSIVRAEFAYEKGLDAALLEVSNALSRARSKLPAEAPPSAVYPVGAFTTPVMVLSLSPRPDSGLDLARVRLLAEGDIRAALLTLPHVADVEVFGGHESAVRIDIDPLKLARFGLTPAQPADLLAKADRDWPLGNLQGGRTLSLTVYGERARVAALRALPLAPGLTLGEVAEVRLASADRYAGYHGNGRPAIALALLRAPGGAVETPIKEAEALLPMLAAQYPAIEFAVSDTQGELIGISNHNMSETLLHAVLFTSLVILLFLGNWRAVVTALVSLPVVFLVTLAILWLLGKELNVLVMTGIILALGMLVDDAVVVLENIERHLGELHEEVRTAVVRGTEEVLFPVFVGTLATAVVIAPLMFVGDIGAFWTLLAFDKALGMPATLGLILLCSIIIKNSILMVDFIQQRRRQGEGAFAAAAGSVVLRYRPILMTAFGTIAGMLPIALQQAVGLERLSPLAFAAIGGLLIGTVLSLFYLPMLYAWVTGRREGTVAAGVLPLIRGETSTRAAQDATS